MDYIGLELLRWVKALVFAFTNSSLLRFMFPMKQVKVYDVVHIHQTSKDALIRGGSIQQYPCICNKRVEMIEANQAEIGGE